MQRTLCTRCKKNLAVVFVARIEDGETKNEGYCLKCARELGIGPINDLIRQMGISDAVFLAYLFEEWKRAGSPDIWA